MPINPKKIVVLDDEESLRVLLTSELASEGYEAFSFASKPEGYDWIAVNQPDLIISDITSPDISGLDLLKLLKQNPQTANIPFLFITANQSIANATLSMKLGAADMISKPYDLVHLLHTIARILNEK